jgi:hypothetical protein
MRLSHRGPLQAKPFVALQGLPMKGMTKKGSLPLSLLFPQFLHLMAEWILRRGFAPPRFDDDFPH